MPNPNHLDQNWISTDLDCYFQLRVLKKISAFSFTYHLNMIFFFYIYSQSLNDCTCFICKSFNQENGNKLMECHTCQNLYHQECHDPVITDEEALDPRLIWNCSTCKPVQQTTVINSKINQRLNMKWGKSIKK